MILTETIKYYIEKSVLCWLATCSTNNVPNVSPKEIFTHYEEDKIIVANIASPGTIKNIKENENVCISFIDVLVQKGYQLSGTAKIIDNTDSEYLKMKSILEQMTGGKFPFSTMTVISVEQSKPILAPKYMFYPETTEQEQIEEAKNAYGII